VQAYFQLHVFPSLGTEPIRPAHALQWWEDVSQPKGKGMLKAWQQGQTG
jgi:hypothetical protein